MQNMRKIPDIPIGIEPLKSGPLNGGGHWIYRFDNGHGASVVCSQYSYGGSEGLYELMVTRFMFSDPIDPNWTHPTTAMLESICKSEECLDDHGMAGWLTDLDVARILGVIRGWEPPNIKQPSAFTDTAYRVTMINHDGVWNGTDTGARW